MTEVEARRAIFSRFITQWPGLSSNVPYATENNALAEPSAVTFARIQIEDLDGQQHTIGGPGVRKYERIGWIDVLLVGPMNVGSEPLRVLGQFVRAIFEGFQFGGVTTHTTSVRPVRNHPEYPGCAVVAARTPFEYFETR